jgi:hypothetical protein
MLPMPGGDLLAVSRQARARWRAARSTVLGWRQLTGAAVALVLSWWVASAPARGQTQDERVALIMSQLPSGTSAEYKAILRRADQADIRFLPLTKSEVWSVPRRRVWAVQRAAARRGVRADTLAPDWNHVFRPMPAHMAHMDMSAEQMAMMNSAATSAVRIMLPSRAAMVEYALTRDAGPEGAKVQMRLNEATLLTLTRTSYSVGPSMLTWRGTVDATGAPATIMWWPGVTMSGTVRHEGRLYSLRRMRGGVHAMAVVEMVEERMPPEHAPMPPRLRDGRSSLADDPLTRQGDASTLKSLLRGARPGTEQPGAGPPAVRRGEPAEGGENEDATINVIVAYTARAAAKYSDIRRELVALAIEEANHSFHNSGLEHVRLNLVHAHQTDYVEDGEHFDHLWRFADKADGYMEEIHALRVEHQADVAVLIVDDAKGCGLATRVYADADEAFAVVHHDCAAVNYSLAHEIGHLIGARHELSLDKSLTPFPYGHGYVNGRKWRDIMSYKDSCGGCPRLPVWSNPDLKIGGDPAGSESANNYRVLAEQAARVARFRSELAKEASTSRPASGPPQVSDQ